jgi:Flp pilus assembly protein TadD
MAGMYGARRCGGNPGCVGRSVGVACRRAAQARQHVACVTGAGAVPRPESALCRGVVRPYPSPSGSHHAAAGVVHSLQTPVYYARHTVAPFVVAAALVTGCRLVQRREPVPPELADARRLCNEGLSAADRQDLVRAETLLERAVKSCPVDVDARRHYADVLWQRGQRMEAVTQIAKALALSPADAGLCTEAAAMYLELGLLAEADRLANEAVRLAPRSAAAWHIHGRLAMARGQFDAAVDDFHRGLAIAPSDRDLLADAAEAYLRLQRPRRALSTLAILGETYGPGQTPARLLALEGLAQESLGRFDDARSSYRQALTASDAPPDVAARLAALEQRGSESPDSQVAGREAAARR